MTPFFCRPLASGLAVLALSGGLLAGPASAFAATAPTATAAASAAADEPASLTGGQQLGKGQGIVSANGTVRFVLQDDGNAVVYSAGRATWSSDTQGRGDRLVMQTDGNVVIYDAAGRPVWSTGTAGEVGSTLWIQDDGNLVLYRSSGSPAWASSVGGRIAAPDDMVLEPGQTLNANQQLTAGPSRAVMQSDGNFVLYKGGNPLWSSTTSGVGNRLEMQTDGNAVIYTPEGAVKWSSGTAGNPGARLTLNPDGNLVIGSSRGLLWSSAGQVRRDTLPDESFLLSGEQLISTNGSWRAVMQRDGNFVVYGPRGADWFSGTSIPGSILGLAHDGYIDMYAPGTQEGQAHWGIAPKTTFTSGPNGLYGPFRLVMQNDGNLVEYDGYGRAVWASRGA